MKKLFAVLVLTAVLLACGCSEKKASLDLESAKGTAPQKTVETTTEKKNEYLDLTGMSGTVIYSQISNIVYAPENYEGTTIKIKGKFNAYKDEKTNKQYFAVLIPDATACCQQGIEFVLKGDPKYPEDYPKSDSEITVEGRFETYKEGKFTYCHLTDAELIA